MAKIIIENFMTSELGLSGNQLVLYAHLWAESKQGSRRWPMTMLSIQVLSM